MTSRAFVRCVANTALALILCRSNAFARCLNSENTAIPLSTPTADFQIFNNGTLLDPRTKLMWMRCPVGQSLNNGVCAGTATLFKWADGLVAAKALSFAGYTDWRIPNPKELLSIQEDHCAGPSFNADLFPVSVAYAYLTSTPYELPLSSVYDDVWLIQDGATVTYYSKNQSFPMLLVRDTAP